MTDETVIATDVESDRRRRWWRREEGFASSRMTSVALALIAALGLFWLLWFRSSWNPPTGGAEWFWVRVWAAFGIYAVIQQMTLAAQTAVGDTWSATTDKIVALAPAAVVLGCELYWLGANPSELSWRHHAVGVMWGVYSFVDFYATDILNQRLRTRQIQA